MGCKELFSRTWANIKAAGWRGVLRYICLKKCCCLIPLRAGVVFLFVLQMICLTPFTVYQRTPNCLVFAVVLMILTTLGAIFFMWAVVFDRVGLLPIILYLTCGNLIFHFAVLDYHYADKNGHPKEKDINKFLFYINIIGIVSYFYLVIMLRNTYVKLKEKAAALARRLQERREV